MSLQIGTFCALWVGGWQALLRTALLQWALFIVAWSITEVLSGFRVAGAAGAV